MFQHFVSPMCMVLVLDRGTRHADARFASKTIKDDDRYIGNQYHYPGWGAAWMMISIETDERTRASYHFALQNINIVRQGWMDVCIYVCIYVCLYVCLYVCRNVRSDGWQIDSLSTEVHTYVCCKRKISQVPVSIFLSVHTSRAGQPCGRETRD